MELISGKLYQYVKSKDCTESFYIIYKKDNYFYRPANSSKFVEIKNNFLYLYLKEDFVNYYPSNTKSKVLIFQYKSEFFGTYKGFDVRLKRLD